MMNREIDEETLEELVNFFKTMGDSTRLKILFAINKKELCVTDLAEEIGMKQSAVSHQLKILKDKRLVKNRRDGKVIYYSYNDSHIANIINTAIEHIKEMR